MMELSALRQSVLAVSDMIIAQGYISQTYGLVLLMSDWWEISLDIHKVVV